MKIQNILLIALLFTAINSIQAQNTATFIIKDKADNDTLFGANCILKNTSIGTSSDENGICQFKDIPNGTQTLEFSYIGFESVEKHILFH